jgi:hypothetical protein
MQVRDRDRERVWLGELLGQPVAVDDVEFDSVSVLCPVLEFVAVSHWEIGLAERVHPDYRHSGHDRFDIAADLGLLDGAGKSQAPDRFDGGEPAVDCVADEAAERLEIASLVTAPPDLPLPAARQPGT